MWWICRAMSLLCNLSVAPLIAIAGRPNPSTQRVAPPPSPLLAPSAVTSCTAGCAALKANLKPMLAERAMNKKLIALLKSARRNGPGEQALQTTAVSISSCATGSAPISLIEILMPWAYEADLKLPGASSPWDLHTYAALPGQTDILQQLFPLCQAVLNRQVCSGASSGSCALPDALNLTACLQTFEPGQMSFALQVRQYCNDQQLGGQLQAWVDAIVAQQPNMIAEGVKTLAAVQMWMAAIQGNLAMPIPSLDLRPYESAIYYSYPMWFGSQAARLGVAPAALCPGMQTSCPHSGTLAQ